MGRNDPYLFVPCLILFSAIVAAAANISRDQDALLSVKAHIINDNPNNILAQNWTSNTSVCSWMGITCDVYGNRVTSLTIPDLGLTGTIPSYLGNLSSLQTLVLSHNWFSGTIPKEIGNLTKLKDLRLRYNKLQGINKNHKVLICFIFYFLFNLRCQIICSSNPAYRFY